MGIVYLADVAGGCSPIEMDCVLKSFLPVTFGGPPKEALYGLARTIKGSKPSGRFKRSTA